MREDFLEMDVAAVSANGIFAKLDAAGFAVVVKLDGDEVYAPGLGQVFMAVEISQC